MFAHLNAIQIWVLGMAISHSWISAVEDTEKWLLIFKVISKKSFLSLFLAQDKKNFGPARRSRRGKSEIEKHEDANL